MSDKIYSLGNRGVKKDLGPRGVGTHHATQRAKIAEKVHKPALAVNVINFELNGFNALK